MPERNDNRGDASGQAPMALLAVARQFDREWRDGAQPDLHAHLQLASPEERPALLVSLVKIDLERHLKRGVPARVESYKEHLEQYLQPGGDHDVWIELIEAEYKMRKRYGEPSLSPEECLGQRFPHLAEQLQGRLTVPFPSPRLPDAPFSCECPCDRRISPLPVVEETGACGACGRTLEYVGRYLKLRSLGEGSYGTVHLAYDTVLGRQVALKEPRSSSIPTSPQQAAAFLAEARYAARLRHPAIVPVFDVFQNGGRCYIVYEFIEGENLGLRLRRGPLPPEQSAALVARLADALGSAHEHIILHRDIKPGNILLDNDGQPYLTDFGIAVLKDNLVREQGTIAGTLPYMSPEQVRGETTELDARTDIYGLGVVLYELLSGRLPFEATQREDLQQQILEQNPWPPSQYGRPVPPGLEQVCLKAMARRKTDRHRYAADLARELRQAVEPEHQPLSAERPQAAPAGPAPPRQDVIPPPPDLCVGRGADRRQVQESLGIGDTARGPGLVALSAVRGWPGVGKTTLARDLAHHAATRASFERILWVDVGQIAPDQDALQLLNKLQLLGGCLGDNLSYLQIPLDQSKPYTNEDARRALSVATNKLAGFVSNQALLLILDDVWEAEHVNPFRIVGKAGALLVTTRVNEVAQALAASGGVVHHLGPLALEDAVDLVRCLAPAVHRSNPNGCERLAQELECLPLALTVAAGLLREEPDCTLDALLQDLQEGKRLLEEKIPVGMRGLTREAPLTVAALLKKSIRVLPREARRCFPWLAAVREDKPVSFDLRYLHELWGEAGCLERRTAAWVTDLLVRRGLLERAGVGPDGKSRYQMHALLVLLAKSMLSRARP